MFTVYIVRPYRIVLDMTTDNETTAKLRVLALEHDGYCAYYE